MADVTEILERYDEALQRGEPQSVDALCRANPQIADLKEQLLGLSRLHLDLDELFRPPVNLDPDRGDLPVLEGYRVVECLGTGGMGAVYLAEQSAPQRLCALKVLHRNIPGGMHRFQREADLAAQLSHPGIATVFACGSAEGRPYLASEYIEGFTLRELMDVAPHVPQSDGETWLLDAFRLLRGGVEQEVFTTEPLPPGVAVDLAKRIAHALAHAHARGVVHRDIKPRNVMTTLEREIKIIDFGIAVPTETADDRVTEMGAFIGSYRYAAPEQLRGEHDRVGPWTDTYALGATLFELLTQHTPFEAATYADRVAFAAHPVPFAPSHHVKQIPADLDSVVMKALHPNPNERFYDGEEFLAALNACTVRRRSWLPRLLPRWLRMSETASLKLSAALMTAAFLTLGFFYVSLEHELKRTTAEYDVMTRYRAERTAAWAVLNEQEALAGCLASTGDIDLKLPAFHVVLRVVEQGVVGAELKGVSRLLYAEQEACVEQIFKGLTVPGQGLSGSVDIQVKLSSEDWVNMQELPGVTSPSNP